MAPEDRLPMWQRILANPDAPMTVLVAQHGDTVFGFCGCNPS